MRQVVFTRQRMFVVTKDGKLYTFLIKEKAPSREELMFAKGKPRYTGDLMIDNPIHVKEAKKIKMAAAGVDHLCLLDQDGEVWAMGDDTFGQCGQTAENRQKVAPFFEVRHRTPQKVIIPHKVKKIVSGHRHTLAVTENGLLFGWGFNSMQQLSNADSYADPDNPQHAIFEPSII